MSIVNMEDNMDRNNFDQTKVNALLGAVSKKIGISSDQLKKELEEGILAELQITGFLNKNVRNLSGGMKKRLSIACALAHHPSVLLLDEPGAALDLSAKELIIRYLQLFCENGGIVLIATHEKAEIEACTRTYILKNGIACEYQFDNDMKKLASQLN